MLVLEQKNSREANRVLSFFEEQKAREIIATIQFTGILEVIGSRLGVCGRRKRRYALSLKLYRILYLMLSVPQVLNIVEPVFLELLGIDLIDSN